MHQSTDMEWLLRECAKTNSLTELVQIAAAELQKFPKGGEVVCGPISTGGRGSSEENLRVFEATIETLKKVGRPIFSQVPYEERIFFFRKRWQDSDPSRAGQYYMPILEEFYYPLFQTKLIKRGWFIPGWNSSFGARWEREQLEEVNADICDLANEWVDQILITA